ncbi:DUF3263 domain-containing protein [Segniliparus rugosus]|uniref:DUF3263 domain-containing protein n=1 Tax=Segniliparus rugosus (strain ATCC BAA-974 / DSM 45345 / CCUG 50838 / CIP 108380 / JCM 13579 / CDC 945) TaxID=679197 RepID=U1N8V0_SEGRC|nr:DUF3263 domain-containing protein [Segniliparus rugosus]ERG69253.1 hypothetical protein HMPREF9336_04144 [Segniliparus rugosus ATCC BAA-974]
MTPDPAALLAFERQWWRNSGNKERAIREAFGLAPILYCQLLNRALDSPAAVAAHPQAAKRLRRLRDKRRGGRAARAV